MASEAAPELVLVPPVPSTREEVRAWAELHGTGRLLEIPARQHVECHLLRATTGTVLDLFEPVRILPFSGHRPPTPEALAAARASWARDLWAEANANQKRMLPVRAFQARRQRPAFPELLPMVEALEALLENLSVHKGAFAPMRYPHLGVRFVEDPPSLISGHTTLLWIADLFSPMQTWNQLAIREAALGALDALCDPQGTAAQDAATWIAAPEWKRTLARVHHVPPRGRGEARLAFRIVPTDFTPVVEVLVQTMRAKGGFSAGKRELPELAARSCEPSDLEERILSSVPEQVAGPRLGAATAAVLELLAGHPRVTLGGHPARIERGRVVVELVEAEGGHRVRFSVAGHPCASAGLRKAIAGRHVLLADATTGVIALSIIDPTSASLVQSLARDPDVVFPPDGVDELLAVLDRASEDVDVVVPDALRGKPVDPDPRLFVRLELFANGVLHAVVLVRPLEGGRTFPPGSGPEVVLGSAGGVRVSARRRRDEEASSAESLLARLPLEGADRDGAFGARVSGDRAADLVAALAEAEGGVVVEWASEESSLRVQRTITRGDLRVRVERKRDWFGVEGEAIVGGDSVDLRALLHAVREGHRYVPLAKGGLALIAKDLREKLAAADDALQTSDRGIEAGHFAAAPLAALVENDGQLRAAKEWIALRARIAKAATFEPGVPKGLRADLRPYQREGFLWLARLAEWGAGACLADEMGLGKTLQTLALLLHRAKRGPALVVAPTSVGQTWLDEGQKFAPSLRISLYRGERREDLLAALGPGDVLVTSYELMLRDEAPLGAISFATLVLDEAHALKNAHAKRTSTARGLSAEFRVALTGTPVENHLGELWSLFRVIAPGLLGPWERFREKFALPIERDRDRGRREALARLLRPYLLRRTKLAVAPELPPRTEIVKHVEPSAEERALYDAERRRALESLSDGNDPTSRFRMLAAITRLRQLACHPRLVDASSTIPSSKLAAFSELVGELREGGHRALVFSQFTSHLALARAALDEAGVAHLYLDGSTPAEERARLVARFQRGEGELFLISLKAGGTGLTLTGADTVLHLDPWWNPAAEDQATDRAHRIGQDKPVTVVRLVTRGTIEEQVVALHGEKRELAEGLLEGGETAGSLSAAALADLIRGGERAAHPAPAEHATAAPAPPRATARSPRPAR